MYALIEFEKEIKSEVTRVLDLDMDIPLEIPDRERGDFALPCFVLSKILKKSPHDIASVIVSKAELEYGRMVQTGPYVNFWIDDGYLAASTIKDCLTLREAYGDLTTGGSIKMIVEHTSANPNGPLHVGRARNPIIGDTIARIYTKAGFDVETQFYVDDIGRQVAILTWGVMNLQESDLPECTVDKIDHKMVRYYQEANARMQESDTILQEIKEMMRDIEEGDEAILSAFSKNSESVMEGMKRSLNRLNIEHDVYKTESSLILDGSVSTALKKMKAVPGCGIEEGAVFYEEEDEKVFLTRGNGSSLYPLRDIAYHLWKSERTDEMVDVLGEDHKVHAGFIKKAMESLDARPIPDMIFHSFVSFQGERMSTRKGAYVTLDETLDTAYTRARKEVISRRGDLSPEEVDEIAEKVGVGAVRYNMIRVQPEKPMDFRWEEALNFQGNSAPFVQYTHARAASIMNKWGGEEDELLSGNFEALVEEGETLLIKKIASYPREIQASAGSKAPHLIANYAYSLAAEFNQFYRDYHVLNADDKVLERLALVKAFKIVISNVLDLLGIAAPEHM